jgi:hypothetical protein
MYYFNSQLLTRWFHLTIKVFHLQIGYGATTICNVCNTYRRKLYVLQMIQSTPSDRLVPSRYEQQHVTCYHKNMEPLLHVTPREKDPSTADGSI